MAFSRKSIIEKRVAGLEYGEARARKKAEPALDLTPFRKELGL